MAPATSFLERIANLLSVACLTSLVCGVLAFGGFWILVHFREPEVVYYSAADQQALCTQWASEADRMPWCQSGEQFNDKDLESWLNANYPGLSTRHSEVVSLFVGWGRGSVGCVPYSPNERGICHPPSACDRGYYSCWFSLPDSQISVYADFLVRDGSLRRWQVRRLSGS